MGFFGKKKSGPQVSSSIAANLRDEKVKSDIILNSIDDGVMVIDSEMTIQRFNPGASHITGWEVEEAQGLDYRSVIRLVDDHENAYPEDKDPFRTALRSGQLVRDNDAILVSRSNKRISLSLNVSPLLDEGSGQVQGVVAVFRDVSEARQQERQRAEFISTASHEMRTPVAAIEGYLSLALNDKVAAIDTRARGYLDKAYKATQHLGELFQDLLTSAKAEDGRLTNHPVVSELGELVELIASDVRFTAEKKNLRVELVLGSEISNPAAEATPERGGERTIRPLYYAFVDPDRLREVITNLFDNAVKYTPSGKIQLGITGNNDVVQIYVRDTGPGIPPEDISHLFQKFYRVDNSDTRTIGGTGLGLFICRKIIELYNGKIWVNSKLGEGSTFFINLPRLDTQQADQLRRQQEQDQVASIANAPR